MKNPIRFLTIFSLFFAFAASLHAHCQVPCGIYGDKTRITLLREHITTIEKSMNQIIELSQDPTKNMNQLVRWVNNKDQHADEFSNIVTYYFLAQRVKVPTPGGAGSLTDYQQKLTHLHQMMVFSMKCKQTNDLQNTAKLTSLIDKFESIYFTAADKAHLKSHSE
jgi:nickel superoxide dismutase